MNISEIYIYPIKSLGGIRLNSSPTEPTGLLYDRRWMLTDTSGNFLSQRKFPQMSLLKVSIVEDNLLVYHKNIPEQKLNIPIAQDLNKNKLVKVWADNLPALLVSPNADAWFSEMLGIDCLLVKLNPKYKRMVKKKYRQNSEQVSFADSMPYLIIGQSSLDELNSRLTQKVPILRFRPNLVFTGGKPFEEDDWQQIKIGSQEFKITKPCARCIITTINLDNGKKGKEPLYTLSKYHNKNGKILIGQNMLSLQKVLVAKKSQRG
ncbi:MAG: MOSC N-terminal beta barrel domain-containing protein, partial [Cyclobacteriaceae bacterium]